MCGGASEAVTMDRPLYGPSPRVRGSPSAGRSASRRYGSIPACAGEPANIPCIFNRPGVHPRVCGGATTRSHVSYDHSGPSPRVRGSLRVRRGDGGVDGSIPACAGEPSISPPRRARRKVHPRVCGGARLYGDSGSAARGPSPRVRGSPKHSDADGIVLRSIPACAGEPFSSVTRKRRHRVHPRVCGGALLLGVQLADEAGPSPRVRGSRPCMRPWR